MQRREDGQPLGMQAETYGSPEAAFSATDIPQLIAEHKRLEGALVRYQTPVREPACDCGPEGYQSRDCCSPSMTGYIVSGTGAGVGLCDAVCWAGAEISCCHQCCVSSTACCLCCFEATSSDAVVASHACSHPEAAVAAAECLWSAPVARVMGYVAAGITGFGVTILLCTGCGLATACCCNKMGARKTEGRMKEIQGLLLGEDSAKEVMRHRAFRGALQKNSMFSEYVELESSADAAAAAAPERRTMSPD